MRNHVTTLTIIALLPSCSAVWDGKGAGYVDVGTNRKEVASRAGQGSANVGPLAGLTNAAGKELSVQVVEAQGGQEKPTVRVVFPSGMIYETYGTENRTQLVAEAGNVITNFILVETTGKVWGKLLDGTFDVLSQESADKVLREEIKAGSKVEIERIRNPLPEMLP